MAQPGDKELVEFVRGRSVPCPKCGYELRDLEQAKCPECGEPLVLKVGSPRTRFGWLVLAMAPGSFSGVAACLLIFPLIRTMSAPPGRGMPIPVQLAVLFGLLSAASLVLIYRERHRIMGRPDAQQIMFAGGVWAIHVLAFAAMIAALLLWP